MEKKLNKSKIIKNTALTITFAQLLLVSNLSFASENAQANHPKSSQAIVFEVIDSGQLLAAGDTNVVCGNNYGCV